MRKEEEEIFKKIGDAFVETTISYEKTRKIQEGFRNKAIEHLQRYFTEDNMSNKYCLKNGETVELMLGYLEAAKQVINYDAEFVKMIDFMKRAPKESHFEIASYDRKIPAGFYFNIHHKGKTDDVGELVFIYVTKEHQGNSLGKILLAEAALDIVNNEENEILNINAANPAITEKLKELGFAPDGKTDLGYDIFMIDLKENKREKVRNTFEEYLLRYVNK